MDQPVNEERLASASAESAAAQASAPGESAPGAAETPAPQSHAEPTTGADPQDASERETGLPAGEAQDEAQHDAPQPESAPQPEAEPQAQAEPQAHADPQAEPEAEAQAEHQAQTEPRAEAGPEPDARPEVEAGPDAGAEPQAQGSAEGNGEPQAAPEPSAVGAQAAQPGEPSAATTTEGEQPQIPASPDSAEAGALVPGFETEPSAAPAAGAAPESSGATAPGSASATEGAAPQKRPDDPQAAAKANERRLRAQQAWERVLAARESNETLTGVVTAAVKGGLLVDVGSIRGFLPASQVRPPHGTPIEALVKAKLPLRVIDIDQGRRRIVVSHRRALEDERRTKRRELLNSLHVGQVREGTVVRLTDFGAFVDLGGIDGLIPMRELAFERVDTAASVVRIGEQLSVEVLRIDEGGKKISLSRRNALADPWRDHGDILRNGTTIEGKVVAKEPRLQVEIAPGLVGTVRESDADPNDYEIGEVMEVTVRSTDRRTRRIVLTTTHAAAAAQPTMSSSGFAPLGVELGRRT